MTSNRKVIMVDMDGVLADFIWAFTTVLATLFGGRPYHTWEQWVWNTFSGFGDEQVSRAWGVVKGSTHFWADVEDMVDIAGVPEVERIMPLYRGSQAGALDLYFVTARVGATAKLQTEQWLIRRGIWTPSVIVSDSKGYVAKAIGATHMVDDSPAQVKDVQEKSPSTAAYMMDRPYNSGAGGFRVSSLRSFVEAVTNNG